ncbi:MAG: bifunctional diaminohydroxyphosphoribosylaminopyrimidine deaminase/5-amino-6-(5-phosphoribosylamino)uracil reductase RibD [Chitinophagales bacterium]|nr:bifunctional diaminohydroxyphosphoribosylaminopyrimidine deaminase/5-amino-6-(5-phosphoribosylamino)uracil reductase RibD [Chitinophagales bacterium]
MITQIANDEIFMQRCLQLAESGAGWVAPNPLVGAVLVHEGRIIGEGWHQGYGQAHAEVNAFAAVIEEDLHLLKGASLYVNLEPCSHHGKTPPCADLIIEKQVKHIVIANQDPNPLVAGKGIQKLRNAGCTVVSGVCEAAGEWLNRRFFTYHRSRRPYITLKWAQSADGFFTKDLNNQHWITGDLSRRLVHRWRSEEAAILVGSGTANCDNPRLDTRFWEGGKLPIRVVLDRQGALKEQLHLLDGSQATIVCTSRPGINRKGVEYALIDKDASMSQVLDLLYSKGINSVLVEGGLQVLQAFINEGLWDEARILSGNVWFGSGVAAPSLQGTLLQQQHVGADTLRIFKAS